MYNNIIYPLVQNKNVRPSVRASAVLRALIVGIIWILTIGVLIIGIIGVLTIGILIIGS